MLRYITSYHKVLRCFIGAKKFSFRKCWHQGLVAESFSVFAVDVCHLSFNDNCSTKSRNTESVV